jgi:hypothetical protein
VVEHLPGADLHGRHRALGLGGLIGGLAMATRTTLLSIIIGGLFVIITMSVVIQIISFKTTGKRVFRMSPLHHHFELAGWSEVNIVVRFWIVAGICVADRPRACSTATSWRSWDRDLLARHADHFRGASTGRPR